MKARGFPPCLRIRRRRDYLQVQRGGEKDHTRHFLVFSRRGATENGDASGWPRLGITVTRKVGNAVARNRIKRLVREVFRRRRSALPLVDVIWVAKRNAATVSYHEVEQQMEAWATIWNRRHGESAWRHTQQ